MSTGPHACPRCNHRPLKPARDQSGNPQPGRVKCPACGDTFRLQEGEESFDWRRRRSQKKRQPKRIRR